MSSLTQLRKVYDKFPVKDMSFEQFVQEIRGLSNPVKIRQDLANIELIKARQRINKTRIDRALKKEG